jgi:hypothetical protein
MANGRGTDGGVGTLVAVASAPQAVIAAVPTIETATAKRLKIPMSIG